MKIRELIATINDCIDTWQRNSAVIVTIFGDRDVSELMQIIEMLKGFLGKK